LSRLRRLDPNHPSIVEELSEVEANHRYEMRIGKAYVNLVKRANYLTTNESLFSDRIWFND
jgi:hypothetical protein